MLINSLSFIAFIILLLIIYVVIPKKVKWVVLLLASYIFYFLNSTKLIVCILLTTLSIYIVGLLMGKVDDKVKDNINKLENKEEKKKIKSKAKATKKKILTVGILFNLGILILMKYTGLINEIFSVNIPILTLALPLGISYYTLQAISYIVDVYRQKIKPDKNLGRLALFLAFFPQLIEGPIGRYDRLASQLYEAHKITFNNLRSGFSLMLWGYFKKMVIADRVAIFVNAIFGNFSEYTGPIVFVAILGYTLQIYAEFSGGIDIVRGVSELFGINLEKNFENPFFAKSIDEFWRRWNITLGTWLKEYVFYPVSLSKFSMKVNSISSKIFKKSYLTKIIPVAVSLLCVWICNGLWHGAGIKYIVYGLYYYSIMMLGKILAPFGEKIIKTLKINTQAWSYKLWQIIRTGVIVCFGMLIFRAETLNVAWEMFKSIFKLTGLNLLLTGQGFLIGGLEAKDLLILAIGVVTIFITSLLKEKGIKLREKLFEQNLVFKWGVLYTIILAILVFGIYGVGYDVQSFIYGQF